NLFDLSEATPSQVDLVKFDRIKTELFEDGLIVEGVHTLVHDDSDEDTDSDFGDDAPTYHEQQLPRHESSNSSFAPLPNFKLYLPNSRNLGKSNLCM
ncbi:hypothetical protein L9F63_013199, partial [Diploptera punctata]